MYEIDILQALSRAAPQTHRDLVERLGGNDRAAYHRIGSTLSALARRRLVCRELRLREGKRRFYYYWLPGTTP